MVYRGERRVFWVVTALLLVLVSVPYIFALAAAGGEHYFGGLLFNPIDGNSYLAKMYEGYRGEWRFTLPYTAEKGQGAYLYTFYLFLGHVARLTDAPLEFVFHAARIISVLLLLEALWRFLKRGLTGVQRTGLAFTWAVLGSGLGWFALPFGGLTSDFWVAEAYPYLTSFVNPHFPLSLAIVLYFLTLNSAQDTANPSRPLHNIGSDLITHWWSLPLGLLLASLSAFGAVLVGLILTILAAWRLLRPGNGNETGVWISRAIWLLIGGGSMTLYQFIAIRSDPHLAAWNAQNITPTPPVWDLALAFGPALWIAVPGAVFAWRDRKAELAPAVVWLCLALGLLLMPFALQRRFLIGFYVPCVVLAVFGIHTIIGKQTPGNRYLPWTLVLLSIPTNLILLLLTVGGILRHEPRFYLSEAEARALTWLHATADQNDVVLSNPILSSFIPAKTGLRVVYGHPFETVDAQTRMREVEAFFAGEMNELEARQWIVAHSVDYIVVDESSPAFNLINEYEFFALRFDPGGGLRVYQVQPERSSDRGRRFG